MRFGQIPVREAEGAILAHSTRCSRRVLRKGTFLGAHELEMLKSDGFEFITVATLNDNDVHEDEAARRVAAALAGRGIRLLPASTGRVNLVAGEPGVLDIVAPVINTVNAVNEAVTVATLPPMEPVEEGKLVATIKIIPFAVPENAVRTCVQAATGDSAALSIKTFRTMRAGLILTRTDAVKATTLDKTTDIVRTRLEALGLALSETSVVDHRMEELSQEIKRMSYLHDLILVYGASAITDRRDVIPAALEMAGGAVEHLGMPVDPGNLLMLGGLERVPVLGLPGCARSMSINGFDFVLQRIAAGLTVTAQDIMAMGVGGLLKEIPLRPRPRMQTGRSSDVGKRVTGAIVLAGGSSRRMGEDNKLTMDVAGKPLICHVIDALQEASVETIVVVTGYGASEVQDALKGRDVGFVHNERFAQGVATSLRKGLSSLPVYLDAVLICLADMPLVKSQVLNEMIAAFQSATRPAIILPVFDGKRGNPVLWDLQFAEILHSVTGDTGARHLIEQNRYAVTEVETSDTGILFDVDTPEMLQQAQISLETGAKP